MNIESTHYRCIRIEAVLLIDKVYDFMHPPLPKPPRPLGGLMFNLLIYEVDVLFHPSMYSESSLTIVH